MNEILWRLRAFGREILRCEWVLQRWNFKAALAGLAARNFKAASKISSAKFRRKAKFKEHLASPRRAGRTARYFVD
ncbi:hypothetical protein [uncultured Campylobacter sp.]|uniref:hypothetical protein n=1 Tax=uncultured Campylobacter sp. TaxID=218934 RepID=UPI00261A894C|nr:hypothetical protein [uncultured Campylobacter sp.]